MAEAMENHPDIVTAKAKLRLAEAELDSKRMEVAKKVTDLWSERRAAAETVESLRQKFGYVETLHNDGQVGGGVEPYEDAREERDRRGSEAGGNRVGIALSESPRQPHCRSKPQYRRTGETASSASRADGRKPSPGTCRSDAAGVQRCNHKQGHGASGSFSLHGVIPHRNIQIDKQALDEEGVTDTPITLKMKGVPLAAVLQSNEDGASLKFVTQATASW